MFSFVQQHLSKVLMLKRLYFRYIYPQLSNLLEKRALILMVLAIKLIRKSSPGRSFYVINENLPYVEDYKEWNAS